jgi:hypothetical protein
MVVHWLRCPLRVLVQLLDDFSHASVGRLPLSRDDALRSLTRVDDALTLIALDLDAIEVDESTRALRRVQTSAIRSIEVAVHGIRDSLRSSAAVVDERRVNELHLAALRV